MPRVPDVKVDTSNVIIIHPGSWIIRVGLATFTVPCTELNVIARKRKLNGHCYVDDFIPQINEWSVQQKSDFFMTVEKVLTMLENSLKSDNTPRHISSPDAIRDFNSSKAAIESNFKGKIIRTDRYVDENDSKIHSEPFNARKATDEFYVGRKVLCLKANSNYNVHFPYKRGDFNLHSNVGGSMTSVIADLETIIVETIMAKLRIRKQLFRKYRVIFIIPDIFQRNHVKLIAEMLLVRLDFQCCFFIQEHVCAAFGSGVTTGCVLDMGDQKTSISCVEDGASISETRVRMNYGGADISQILLMLLKIREFPYHRFSDSDRNDCCIIRKLAIDSCHLDMDICRPLERSFFVMKGGETAIKYKIQIGDESIVAPLAAMYPELLKLTGPKYMIGQSQLGFESEDPKDELFLKEITKAKSKETVNADTNTVSDKDADTVRELNSDHNLLESGQMYSLTQAILYSIDKCPNDESKKKMLNNIVIVGGHSKTMNLKKWLLKRLRIETNNIVKPADVEILTPPKDFDPSWISWKGAAILAGFETTKELWINKSEWVKSGAKILREKSIFPWWLTEMKEMVGGCCVCSDERGWSENPLVYCDGQSCNVAVHQACYGIVSVPTGPWFCRKCESDDRSQVKCELCPSRHGALKKTNTDSWAHVVCALYIPEVRFGNVTTMEPILLNLIPSERYNKVCYICESKNRGSKSSSGACMQCNKVGCKQQFHVTCAQTLGLLCEEAGNYLDNVKYCGYCQHHYSKLKKGSNVKLIPPYKPVNTEKSPGCSPEMDANRKSNGSPQTSSLTNSVNSNGSKQIPINSKKKPNSVISNNLNHDTNNYNSAITNTISGSLQNNNSITPYQNQNTNLQKTSGPNSILSSQKITGNQTTNGFKTNNNQVVNNGQSMKTVLRPSNSVSKLPTPDDPISKPQISSTTTINGNSNESYVNTSSTITATANNLNGTTATGVINNEKDNENRQHYQPTVTISMATATVMMLTTAAAVATFDSEKSNDSSGRSTPANGNKPIVSGNVGDSDNLNETLLKSDPFAKSSKKRKSTSRTSTPNSTISSASSTSSVSYAITTNDSSLDSRHDLNSVANSTTIISSRDQDNSSDSEFNDKLKKEICSVNNSNQTQSENSSPMDKISQINYVKSPNDNSVHNFAINSNSSPAILTHPGTSETTNIGKNGGEISENSGLKIRLEAQHTNFANKFPSKALKSPLKRARSQSLDKMNVKLTRTRKKITSSQKAAFKMRANHLVNSVSSPTKSLSVSGSSEIEPAKSESSIAASPKLSPKAGTSYGESLPSHDISIQLRNHIRAAGPRSKKNRKPNNFGLNSDSMVYTNASFTTNEYEPDDYKIENVGFPTSDSAPQMLGNQLNPNSSMAQRMASHLNSEIETHVYKPNQPTNTRLVGPSFPGRQSNYTNTHESYENKLFNSNEYMNNLTNRGLPTARNDNQGSEPLEKLLERHWEKGSQFLMEQAQYFDVASLLSCLNQLKAENKQMEEKIQRLSMRRADLLAVNARLSLPSHSQQLQGHVHPVHQLQSHLHIPANSLNNEPPPMLERFSNHNQSLIIEAKSMLSPNKVNQAMSHFDNMQTKQHFTSHDDHRAHSIASSSHYNPNIHKPPQYHQQHLDNNRYLNRGNQEDC